MIDENKLIEDFMNYYLVKNDGTWNDAMDRAVFLAETAPKVMEWIPVAYRLPETPLANIYSEDVFVACSNGRSLLYKVGWYNNEEKEWDKALENYDVVAWMPIPKYKGE